MRHIAAPSLVFFVLAFPACGPRLPGIDMASRPDDRPPPADAGRSDAGLRATPPPDAPLRIEAAAAAARSDALLPHPEAGPPEARPDAAATQARADAAAPDGRADVASAEARPDAPLVETRPEASAERVADAPLEAPPEAPVARAPREGEVRIVEALIDPDGNDLGHEWFEILNVTGEPLSLAELHVADSATDVAVEAGVLAGGGRLVLGQSLDRAHNGDAPVDVSYGTKLALNNDADRIAVCLGPCADGVVLDEVPWSAALGAAYIGHAVIIDYKTGAHCPATDPYGAGGNFGTPGGPDLGCPLTPKLPPS
jgi:hypothetical protein